jgi:hypothetical protein
MLTSGASMTPTMMGNGHILHYNKSDIKRPTNFLNCLDFTIELRKEYAIPIHQCDGEVLEVHQLK